MLLYLIMSFSKFHSYLKEILFQEGFSLPDQLQEGFSLLDQLMGGVQVSD